MATTVSKYGDGSTPILDDLERSTGVEGTLDGSKGGGSEVQKGLQKQLVSAFDANHDGKLEGDERVAAEKYLKDHDGDKNQRISDKEAEKMFVLDKGGNGHAHLDLDENDINSYFGGKAKHDQAAGTGVPENGSGGTAGGTSSWGGFSIDMTKEEFQKLILQLTGGQTFGFDLDSLFSGVSFKMPASETKA